MKHHFAIFCIALVLALLLSGCAGKPGDPGQDGATGPKGDNGTPGMTGPGGDTGAPGQDGSPGQDGQDGAPGQDGATGPKGADGTITTVVQLCPGYTSYSSTFIEVALCINNELYGVYSANGGFLTKLPPGNYSSNGIGSACNLTVHPNCQVTPL